MCDTVLFALNVIIISTLHCIDITLPHVCMCGQCLAGAYRFRTRTAKPSTQIRQINLITIDTWVWFQLQIRSDTPSTT